MDTHESLNAFIRRLIIVSLQKANYPNRKQLHHRKGLRRTNLSLLYSKALKMFYKL